jgi:hypothetical protein
MSIANIIEELEQGEAPNVHYGTPHKQGYT